jgi:hypothetical protein
MAGTAFKFQLEQHFVVLRENVELERSLGDQNPKRGYIKLWDSRATEEVEVVGGGRCRGRWQLGAKVSKKLIEPIC